MLPPKKETNEMTHTLFWKSVATSLLTVTIVMVEGTLVCLGLYYMTTTYFGVSHFLNPLAFCLTILLASFITFLMTVDSSSKKDALSEINADTRKDQGD